MNAYTLEKAGTKTLNRISAKLEEIKGILQSEETDHIISALRKLKYIYVQWAGLCETDATGENTDVEKNEVYRLAGRLVLEESDQTRSLVKRDTRLIIHFLSLAVEEALKGQDVSDFNLLGDV